MLKRAKQMLFLRLISLAVRQSLGLQNAKFQF